ncbi:MAG: lysophospholipid acyltransferase family protein [Pseudonocardiaceae bacterium]
MSHPHPWMPVSPCGAGCLPAADAVPVVGRASRLLRLLAVTVTLLAGVALAVGFPWLRPADRKRTLRAWSGMLLKALRIQLVVTGGDRFGPTGVGVLVVSNHLSWLDLVVLSAVQPLHMVAKSEVRTWPVIGLLARRADTVFMDRERLSALPQAVATVSGALASGATIGVFPEGTTWCGRASGRFRPALFQAAVDTGTPVRPVALGYRLAGIGTTTVASFVGSTTLWESVMLVAGVRGLVVDVHLLPLLPSDGLNRRALAAGAQAAVTAAAPTLRSGEVDPGRGRHLQPPPRHPGPRRSTPAVRLRPGRDALQHIEVLMTSAGAVELPIFHQRPALGSLRRC